MGLVPCPNNGACGSRSHNQKSARYRECLASARFSGRGTSVSGMIVPKAPKDDVLSRRLGSICWSSGSVIVPAQHDTPEIEVWRRFNGSDFCARFEMPVDWGGYLKEAGMIYDRDDYAEVCDIFEEHDSMFEIVGKFFGMENCDMPYGLSNNYIVGDIVLRGGENYDDTIEDVVDMVREKIQLASDEEDTPRSFAEFMRKNMKRD